MSEHIWKKGSELHKDMGWLLRKLTDRLYGKGELKLILRFVFCISLFSLVLLNSPAFAQNYPEDSPEYGAQQWLIGALTTDGLLLGRYTCNHDAEVVSQESMIADALTGVIIGGIESFTGYSVDVQVDLLDTDFIVTEQDDVWATVQISGEIRIVVGGGFESTQAEGVLHLLYENDRWRVCEGYWEQDQARQQLAALDTPDFRIVFTSTHEGIARLYTMNADGTNLIEHAQAEGEYFWSPDSQAIAFRIDPDGDGIAAKLYLASVDRTGMIEVQNVTNVSNWEWSPDSQKLAFEADPDGDGIFDLYLVNADGTGLTAVARNSRFGSSWSTWSPDSQKLAFEADPDSDGHDNLYLFNLNGMGLVELSQNASGGKNNWSWSPDSSKYAFLADDNTLYLANADGTGLTEVVQNMGDVPDTSDTELHWLPDSQSFSVIADPDKDGVWTIFLVNADTTGLTILVQDVWSIPIWSPDNQKFVFFADQDGDGVYTLHLAKADGTIVADLTQILPGGDYDLKDDLPWAWAPDSQRLAIIVNTLQDTGSNLISLYLINTDGTGLTELAQNTTGFSGWEWSPDSQKFIFETHSDSDGIARVYLGNVNDAQLIEFAQNVTLWHYPWSPDSQKLVFGKYDYATGYADLYLINADGTGLTQIITQQIFLFSIEWTPDGEWVLLTTQIELGHILFLARGDGSIIVPLFEHDFIYEARWLEQP